MTSRLFAAFVLFWALAVPARANPCALPDGPVEFGSSGMGGTGLTADGGIGGTGHAIGGSGTGGTGIHAGSGIGGTGARVDSSGSGSGMGGTGVVGVITGFGSICVAGLEIHYDQSTPVSVDGLPGSVGQLATGQLVSVVADGGAGSLKARHIDLNSAVVGPVEAVASDGKSFRVLRQSVRLAGGGTAPRVGEFVRVDGFRNAGGEILSTRVERLPASRMVSVSGTVTATGGKARIGELTAVGAGHLPAGTPVRLTGRIEANGVLAVSEVEVAPEMRQASKAGRMVLQGVVNKVDSMGVSLGYARLDLPKGRKPDVEVGQWLRVEVERGPDGRMDVQRIHFDLPRPARAGAPRPVVREPASEGRQGTREHEAGGPRDGAERSEAHDRGSDNHANDVEKAREFERIERGVGGEKAERVERPERVEIPEAVERPERVELPEKPDVPDKPEVPEKVERYDN